MSNSATNVEIEDVLSSIRRLVSDDSRGQNQTGTASEGDAAQDFGRLVLTPAQRVPDDSPQIESADIQDTTAAAEPILLTEAYAPPEASEPEQDQPTQDYSEPDHTEQPVHHEAAQDNDDHWEEASDANIVSDIIQEELQAALGALDLGSDNQNDHADDQSEGPSDVHSDEWHEDEAEVEAAEVLFENAAEDIDQPDDTEVQESAPEHDVAEPVEQPHVEEPQVEEVRASEADDSVDDERARTLEAKIAELEAMIATNDATWDGDVVDETGNAAYMGDASLPWEDASFSDSPMAAFENASVEEAAAMSMERVAEPAAQDATEAEPEPAAMIDEDMLREMVTQIVRQELQGKLGERITRSVRKLVRQEIHRALMSQEFE